MKRVILMIAFSILSGCGMLRPFIGVSEAEKVCKNVAIIVEKDDKGVVISIPYSYSKTIKILRQIFMPHHEFVVEKFGEKNYYYGMCRVYNAGVFGKKIRLLVIEKSENVRSENVRSENVRIWTWTGEISVDGKISESNEVSQIFAKEISQSLMK